MPLPVYYHAFGNRTGKMTTNRLEVLKNMVEQDPGSVFARYGLAMEYVNQGQNEQAVAEFETLLQTDANYGAGYYHAGRTLEKLGRVEEARSTYQRGIEVTTRTGDQHTRSELQAALDMVGL